MADPVHQEAQWSVEIQPDRETVAIVPVGELDLATVADLERCVMEVRDAGFSAVRLDLRRLTFIDSAGLRLVVQLARSAELDLSLLAGPPAVQRMFEVTGLATTLPFERRHRFPRRSAQDAGVAW